MTLNIINFVDMVRREGLSFMECEESFITMKLIWHDYLVPSLDICIHETLTDTGLSTSHAMTQHERCPFLSSGPRFCFEHHSTLEKA